MWLEESQRIPKVIEDHPLGTMNVCVMVNHSIVD